jgi:hypothetical protein
VVHELPQNVNGGSVVGVALCVGVTECVRVDLGSVEWHRISVRIDFAAVERLKAADPGADRVAETVAAEVRLIDGAAGEQVLL